VTNIFTRIWWWWWWWWWYTFYVHWTIKVTWSAHMKMLFPLQ